MSEGASLSTEEIRELYRLVRQLRDANAQLTAERDALLLERNALLKILQAVRQALHSGDESVDKQINGEKK